MENALLTAMNQGQNRAPNTIKLRKAYNDYAIEAQSNGQTPMPFEQWAKINYPDMQIVNP